MTYREAWQDSDDLDTGEDTPADYRLRVPGGSISNEDMSGCDIKERLGIAYGAVEKLRRIWEAKDITKLTKVRVYEALALVLSVFHYNSETWSMTKKHGLWRRNMDYDGETWTMTEKTMQKDFSNDIWNTYILYKYLKRHV